MREVGGHHLAQNLPPHSYCHFDSSVGTRGIRELILSDDKEHHIQGLVHFQNGWEKCYTLLVHT